MKPVRWVSSCRKPTSVYNRWFIFMKVSLTSFQLWNLFRRTSHNIVFSEDLKKVFYIQKTLIEVPLRNFLSVKNHGKVFTNRKSRSSSSIESLFEDLSSMEGLEREFHLCGLQNIEYLFQSCP